MSHRNVLVATRIPKNTANKIHEAIRQGQYLNIADFLRVATRAELDRTIKRE